MRTRWFRLHAILACLVAALALLAACGGQPTPTPTQIAATPLAPASPPATSPPATPLATTAALPAPTPTVSPTVPTTTATTPPVTATPTLVPTPASTATATRAPAPPPPTAAPTQAPADTTGRPEAGYLDDRSTAEAVIRSYYDAINRREYARAYGYWERGVSPAQLPPFPQFQQGYADTASVRPTTGQVRGDVGAGQLYYSVPVVLDATTKAGASQRFAGCYVLHLGRPQIQTAPPFHPLAIQSASIREAPAGTDVAGLLADACAGQGQTSPLPPGATPGPAAIDGAGYLDDRSSADAALRSFYNAINRKEYARAYSYWEPGAEALQQMPPFDQFQQGYAHTAAVQLTAGPVVTGAAAGNLYFSVPVTLRATTAAGATQTFVGCYRLHIGQPANQAEPPFQPLGIQSASIRQVPNDADAAALMAQSCH